MRPISVPQVGRPETKLLVPSIGSRTQTYSASGRSGPYSSPITPWAGKVCAISRRMAASAPRSASVTGSNTPPRDLSSAPNRAAKKRENHLARNLRESLNEGREVNSGHSKALTDA